MKQVGFLCSASAMKTPQTNHFLQTLCCKNFQFCYLKNYSKKKSICNRMCEINICYSGLLYVLSVSAWVPPVVKDHEY